MYFDPLARSRDKSDCFVLILLVIFYFQSALLSDDDNNLVYVRGYKYVLSPSQNSSTRRLAAKAKITLSQAKDIFTPENTNPFVLSSYVRDESSVSQFHSSHITHLSNIIIFKL